MLRDTLFLVKNGVPFDVAFSLDPINFMAYVAVMSELVTGKKPDW